MKIVVETVYIGTAIITVFCTYTTINLTNPTIVHAFFNCQVENCLFLTVIYTCDTRQVTLAVICLYVVYYIGRQVLKSYILVVNKEFLAVNKYLVSDQVGQHNEYTLRLETFCTGSVTKRAIPTDFVIVLDNSGYSVRKFHDTNQDSEWYQITLAPAIDAIHAVKEGRVVLTPSEKGETETIALFDQVPAQPAKPKITLRE